MLVSSLAQLLAAFARFHELAVAFGVDGSVVAEELVVGGDIADGTVQTDLVVVLDVIGDDPSRVFQRQRDLGANALALDRFVEAFELAVALRIIGRSPDLGHAGDANELLEVFGDERRSVVGDDARACVREFFLLARWMMVVTSASFMVSRISQWTMKRL